MLFLKINILWLTIWIRINVGTIPGVIPFDPFPFGLLTMIVSLEAIVLSIIILISQNQAAKFDPLREEIDLQVNVIAEEEITIIIKHLTRFFKKSGIEVDKDSEIKSYAEATDTRRIEDTLKKWNSR